MRLIDADGIGEEFREYKFDIGYSVGDLINAQPTVELQIILCKNCSKHIPFSKYCTKHHKVFGDYDFCSYAERMEVEHEISD